FDILRSSLRRVSTCCEDVIAFRAHPTGSSQRLKLPDFVGGFQNCSKRAVDDPEAAARQELKRRATQVSRYAWLDRRRLKLRQSDRLRSKLHRSHHQKNPEIDHRASNRTWFHGEKPPPVDLMTRGLYDFEKVTKKHRDTVFVSLCLIPSQNSTLNLNWNT